jgi:flavin-dependent dehydrogenase
MTKKYDLVIIGSGPAGTSTALHLLQLDTTWAGRMLVLEKATHPRDKLCGGGVTLLGLQVLHDLGIEWPFKLSQVFVEDIHLVYGKHTVHVHAMPGFVVFHRKELDAYLADQAKERGMSLHENESAISYQLDEKGVTVNTTRDTYFAQVLVGADGSNGVVRRTLRRDETHPRVARLLEVFHSAPSTTAAYSQDSALFDFTPMESALQGYFWNFPTHLNGQAAFNNGVYDARMVHRRQKAELKRILAEGMQILGTDPATVKLAGHPIHWFSPRNLFSKPRLLLVGDTAGVDPLFGEGIAPALGYGQVAASAIQAAFTSGDFSFRHYRRQVFTSTVGRYLLLRWAAAWWVYRLSPIPGFMPLVWKIGGWLVRIWPKLAPSTKPAHDNKP